MRIECILLAGVCALATACVHPNAIDTRGLLDGEAAVAVTESAIEIVFPARKRDSVNFPRGDESHCASPRLTWDVVFDVPPVAPSVPFRHFALSVCAERLKRPQHTMSDVLANGFLNACVSDSHFLTCATPVDGAVTLKRERLRIHLSRRGVVDQLLRAMPLRADVNFYYNCDPSIGGTVLVGYPRAAA